MRIALSVTARVELLEIWNYNAESHNIDHADDYEAFLIAGIASLATRPEAGMPIDGFPDRRALTMKRKPRGHGHVAIYRVGTDTIRILHVFHTAQDIQGRMEQE